MVVKYMHYEDDLAERRTREASFGAQRTNHSANSMCAYAAFIFCENLKVLLKRFYVNVDFLGEIFATELLQIELLQFILITMLLILKINIA